MSRTTDADLFFQTTDSIAETSRKAKKSTNKHGSPIQLPSKILAAIADPTDPGRLYVAEAAGTVRRVVLETGHKSHVFRGPTTPLTSLANSLLHPIIYAGSWDKTIWSWDISTRAIGTRFRGHTDFVKCVLVLSLPTIELLISGSSDATIILWNSATGDRLQTLKGHSMGVLALAIDPLGSVSPPEFSGDQEDEAKHVDQSDRVTLFSASSDRTILRWHISFSSETSSSATPKVHATQTSEALTPHATSIYALLFSPPASGSGDLYTASADGTSLRLSHDHDFSPDTKLDHGDYVRAVAVSADERYIVTAGRSEDVRVWDSATAECVGNWVGHYEEVMGLLILPESRGSMAERIVSVGIDGTVRTWPLSEEAMENARVERDAEERGEVKQEDVIVKAEGGLTAEEEAELRELMDE